MPTLTPTLTLSSSDVNSDTINISVTDSLSVAGDAENETVVTSTSATKFLESDDYNKSYVYVRNLSTTALEIIHIISGGTGDNNIVSLGAEEFAFFPWSAAEDLNWDAAQGNPVLEFAVFETTA